MSPATAAIVAPCGQSGYQCDLSSCLNSVALWGQVPEASFRLSWISHSQSTIASGCFCLLGKKWIFIAAVDAITTLSSGEGIFSFKYQSTELTFYYGV